MVQSLLWPCYPPDTPPENLRNPPQIPELVFPTSAAAKCSWFRRSLKESRGGAGHLYLRALRQIVPEGLMTRLSSIKWLIRARATAANHSVAPTTFGPLFQGGRRRLRNPLQDKPVPGCFFFLLLLLLTHWRWLIESRRLLFSRARSWSAEGSAELRIRECKTNADVRHRGQTVVFSGDKRSF